MPEKFEMSGQDSPKKDPAPSSDSELNEMLEKMGKIIEGNPKKENIHSGIHSTIKIHEDAEYKKARERARKTRKKTSRLASGLRPGTSWAGIVGDKIDEAEGRMDQRM